MVAVIVAVLFEPLRSVSVKVAVLALAFWAIVTLAGVVQPLAKVVLMTGMGALVGRVIVVGGVYGPPEPAAPQVLLLLSVSDCTVSVLEARPEPESV